MSLSSAVSSRHAVLVAVVLLLLACRAAAQPMPDSVTDAGRPDAVLATSGSWASLAQSGQGGRTVSTPQFRPELFVGWASARLGPSKTDLGPAWSNVGGGMGVRLYRRLGVEFELSHSVESALRDVDGLRQGATSVTFGSAKALVYLLTGRVQPYLGFGVGLVSEEGVAPSYCDAGHPPRCDYAGRQAAEVAYHNKDVGGAASAGVRIAATPRTFIKAELGAYAGLVRRVSFAGGYQF